MAVPSEGSATAQGLQKARVQVDTTSLACALSLVWARYRGGAAIAAGVRSRSHYLSNRHHNCFGPCRLQPRIKFNALTLACTV